MKTCVYFGEYSCLLYTLYTYAFKIVSFDVASVELVTMVETLQSIGRRDRQKKYSKIQSQLKTAVKT